MSYNSPFLISDLISSLCKIKATDGDLPVALFLGTRDLIAFPEPYVTNTSEFSNGVFPLNSNGTVKVCAITQPVVETVGVMNTINRTISKLGSGDTCNAL